MMTAVERRKVRLERARARRARMRTQGMKQVRLWVHDRSSSDYVAEARRQSHMVRNSPQAQDDQAYVEGISEVGDWQ